jgi:hypothetical protein
MTETETPKEATIDPRLRCGCGSNCCGTFKGEAKDIPFLCFPFPMPEEPWLNAGKIQRFLRGHQRGADGDELLFGGHPGMAYGRCGLSELLAFSKRHLAGSKQHSWYSDTDGRLILEIDGTCFCVAHRINESQDFGKWLDEATSGPCPLCKGKGRVHLDWDPTREGGGDARG